MVKAPVDDERPEEGERDECSQACPLGCATHEDRNGGYGEGELEDAEQHRRKCAGCDLHDILVAEVGRITDEAIAGTVRQRVSEEHPLTDVRPSQFSSGPSLKFHRTWEFPSAMPAG